MVRGAPRITRRLCRYLAIVFAAGLGLAIATPISVSATTPPPPVVAPYVDMGGSNLDTPSDPGMLSDALDANLSDFTAGFVLGSGCAPTWDDWQATSATAPDNQINNRIDNAVHAGHRVTPIVSFGGQGGSDLAITCTNATSLLTAYQSVITRFSLTRVDFDVEGAALTDTTSIAARFTAIKALVRNNTGLQVSFTLPSDYYGLASDGLDFLSAAKSAGVRPALVNIMAMEFSTPPSGSPAAASMGAATTNAAQQTLAQMKTVWSDSTYQNLGITPMIGQNINGKVFTLADAATVDDFARKTAHIGRLAFWSLNRDRACNPQSEDLSACSKVTQNPLDFTNAFLKASSK